MYQLCAKVEVVEGLDGWLSVRHEGRIIAFRKRHPVRYSYLTGTRLPDYSFLATWGRRPERTTECDSPITALTSR